MNRILATLLLSGIAWCSAAPAHATLNIQVLNTSITNGGSGFIDVVVSGGSDLLQTFDFEFTITPQGAVSSNLRFVAVQPDPQLNDPAFSPNYVFAGDSLNVVATLPMGQVNLAQNMFIGSDSTNSGNNVTLNAPRLLSRLQLEHIVPIGQSSSGDVFQIALTNGNFLDQLGTPVAFTSVSGSATIAPTAVPEPSSMALLSIVLGGAAVYRRRQRKLNVG